MSARNVVSTLEKAGAEMLVGNVTREMNQRICNWLNGFLLIGLALLSSMNPVRADINVKNFGAVGDYLTLNGVNVVSNSTAIACPGAAFLPSDTNKIIEVFNAGIFRSVSNETLVAVIVSVSSPSNVTVSVPAGRTANGLAGCYGTDNRPAFSNAVAACSMPTDTVVIPSGNYLLIDTNIDDPWVAGVVLMRGGITFEGQGNAVLVGQGGWRDTANGAGVRGALFIMLSPMTNDYPLVFTNLTFYGGTHGYEGGGANGPDPTTGEGWDGTHHAIAYWTTVGYIQLTTSNYINGCTFHGWRGEMIISGLAIASGLMVATNCVFYDGNGSALNMNMAHDWNDCVFSNMFMVEEFYRSYATNGSTFRNSQILNVDHGISLNGGFYGVPNYAISNITFVTTNDSAFFLLTTPASDVLVISNSVSGGMGIALGSAGYQDLDYNSGNSNLLFAGNYFTNCYYAFTIEGSGLNSVMNVSMVSNYFDHCSHVVAGWGYGTNVTFAQNVANYANGPSFDSTALQGQYVIEAGNSYPVYDYGFKGDGTTNQISYGLGSHAQFGWNQETFYLDDAASKIPPGATLTLTNWSSTQSYPVFLNSALAGSPLTMAPNQQQTFIWSGTNWTPQITLSITVNSGTGTGTYTNGATIMISANLVPGLAFSYWSGTTNVVANPFSAITTATLNGSNVNLVAHYAPMPPGNLRFTN